MLPSRSLEAYLHNSNYIKQIYKYQYSILQNINVDIYSIFKLLSSIDEINNNDKNTVITNIQNIINCIDYKISQSFYNGLLVFTPLTVSPINKLSIYTNSFYHTLFYHQSFTVGTNMLGFDIFNMAAPSIALDSNFSFEFSNINNTAYGSFLISSNSILTSGNNNGTEHILSFFSPGNIFLLADSTKNIYIQITSYITKPDYVDSVNFQVLDGFIKSPTLSVDFGLAARSAPGTSLVPGPISTTNYNYSLTLTTPTLTLINYLSINYSYDSTSTRHINQWKTYDSTFLTSYINKLNVASTQISNIMAQIKVNIQNIESYNKILQDRISGAKTLDSFFYLN
jgi:hypothetical protein